MTVRFLDAACFSALFSFLSASVGFGIPIGGGFPIEIVGNWTAFGKTAIAITGDVRFSKSEVVFHDGQRLPLQFVGTSKDVMLSPDDKADLVAWIFRISKPRDLVLLNGNILCGRRSPPTFLTVSVKKATPYELGMMGRRPNDLVAFLDFDVVTGSGTPNSDMDMGRVCSTYSFTRKLTGS